jgi:hypothetical protein
MRTSQKTPEAIFTIGLDLGTNTFHLVGMVHIFVSERSGRGLIRGGMRSKSGVSRRCQSQEGRS